MLSGISQKHNMRSSPCRFTEICNSQCLSHFAAPFIVVRTETSIAESCNEKNGRSHWQVMTLKRHAGQRQQETCRRRQLNCMPHCPRASECRKECQHRNPYIHTQTLTRTMHRGIVGTCANDPSAGSPTETLLRLLLPLSDKVH